MFLDTSGLLSLLSARETDHRRARELFTASTSYLTHNYVLAELIALATARGLPRSNVLEFVACLVEVPEVQVVWVDHDSHNRAMELLRNRLDKSYSLCDAVSFILMRETNLLDALTTDHHFTQEGFRILLR